MGQELKTLVNVRWLSRWPSELVAMRHDTSEWNLKRFLDHVATVSKIATAQRTVLQTPNLHVARVGPRQSLGLAGPGRLPAGWVYVSKCGQQEVLLKGNALGKKEGKKYRLNNRITLQYHCLVRLQHRLRLIR